MPPFSRALKAPDLDSRASDVNPSAAELLINQTAQGIVSWALAVIAATTTHGSRPAPSAVQAGAAIRMRGPSQRNPQSLKNEGPRLAKAVDADFVKAPLWCVGLRWGWCKFAHASSSTCQLPCRPLASCGCICSFLRGELYNALTNSAPQREPWKICATPGVGLGLVTCLPPWIQRDTVGSSRYPPKNAVHAGSPPAWTGVPEWVAWLRPSSLGYHAAWLVQRSNRTGWGPGPESSPAAPVWPQEHLAHSLSDEVARQCLVANFGAPTPNLKKQLNLALSTCTLLVHFSHAEQDQRDVGQNTMI